MNKEVAEMRRYLSLCLAALAVVGVLIGGVQADNGAQPDSVKFIWNINIPGVLTIPLDNYTIQEGNIFKWQEVSIPVEYQGLVSVYWEAMGNSSITVNENAIHQNITIVITVQPGGDQMFGYSIPITMQFEVYDGIVGGNSVEGLTLLNPPGTHFDFGCPDGLVLYFDLSPSVRGGVFGPLRAQQRRANTGLCRRERVHLGGHHHFCHLR
jgi:hypothetical protein